MIGVDIVAAEQVNHASTQIACLKTPGVALCHHVRDWIIQAVAPAILLATVCNVDRSPRGGTMDWRRHSANEYWLACGAVSTIRQRNQARRRNDGIGTTDHGVPLYQLSAPECAANTMRSRFGKRARSAKSAAMPSRISNELTGYGPWQDRRPATTRSSSALRMAAGRGGPRPR